MHGDHAGQRRRSMLAGPASAKRTHGCRRQRYGPRACATTQRTSLLFVDGERLPVLLLDLLELLVDDELLVRGKALPHRLDVRERDDGRRGRRGRSRGVRGARRGGECAGRGAEGETRTRQAEGLHGDDGGDEEEE